MVQAKKPQRGSTYRHLNRHLMGTDGDKVTWKFTSRQEGTEAESNEWSEYSKVG